MVVLAKFSLAALLAFNAAICVTSQPTSQPAGEGPVVSGNPPNCVRKIANGIFHVVRGTTEIVETTVYCAQEFGWFGQTIYANKLIFPFHNPRTCARGVFKILAEYSEATTDFFDADTICPVYNKRGGQSACGQVITAFFEKSFDALEALVGTATACAPPGTDPPYYANQDIPIEGFVCWDRVWRVIERSLVAGKNLDVAIETCPSAVDERYDNAVQAREDAVQNIARDQAGLPPLPPTFGNTRQNRTAEAALQDLAGAASWQGNEAAARHYREAAKELARQRNAKPPPALVRAVDNSVPKIPPTTVRPTMPPTVGVAPVPGRTPGEPSALSAAWQGLQHPLAPFEAAVGNIGTATGWSSQASQPAAPAERRRLLDLDFGSSRGGSRGGARFEASSKALQMLARIEAIKDTWQIAMKLYDRKKGSAEESLPRKLKEEPVLSDTNLPPPTLHI